MTQEARPAQANCEELREALQRAETLLAEERPTRQAWDRSDVQVDLLRSEPAARQNIVEEIERLRQALREAGCED